MQLLDPLLRLLLELADRTEPDRLGRTGLGAGRLHSGLQPVIAKGALLSHVRYVVDPDHPERARADAGPASVAGIRLDYHGVELGPDDGVGGTDLEARRIDAVLADVAHHQPASVNAVFGELLHELHVAPVDPVE